MAVCGGEPLRSAQQRRRRVSHTWRTEDRRDAVEQFERPQRGRTRLYNYGPLVIQLWLYSYGPRYRACIAMAYIVWPT